MKTRRQQYSKDGFTFFIKENSWIARMAAMKLRASNAAIVLGKTIHLHNCSAKKFLNNERWLRHEMTHLRQFQQYGFLKFIFLYLIESIKHGYHNNRFEKEAREAEGISLQTDEEEAII